MHVVGFRSFMFLQRAKSEIRLMASLAKIIKRGTVWTIHAYRDRSLQQRNRWVIVYFFFSLDFFRVGKPTESISNSRFANRDDFKSYALEKAN